MTTSGNCDHYFRRCKFVSPCCQKIYTCRFCHNDNESHEINRFEVKEIVCSNCDCRQRVSNECVECGIQFAKYFCAVCNLPFAICLTIESREIIITVINAEFVALQTTRNIDTAMFVTRVLLTLEREISRTFAERTCSTTSVPSA